ncbi:mitochondrial calcium uniporter regulator 1 isoform X1 [Colossoma macropomum]|uniref:mitochondrial calcium uniporter regulator 1 isoform X1 n=1 Tax=Colossoma macropomum TaxID=42526 RepID=UPI0018640AFC|nr:mitochondrial calcium uniporter regulator 1 isoform X1 [Colossoma macropomum]
MLVKRPHTVAPLSALEGLNKRCSCRFHCGSATRGALAVSVRRAAALRRCGRAELPPPPPPALEVNGQRLGLREETHSFHKLFSFCQKATTHLTFAVGPPLNGTQVHSGAERVSFMKGLRRLLFRELSTSIKAMQYDLGRTDLAKSGHRKLMFDTHVMCQLMEESGFTSQQAEVIVKMLVNTTNSNMDVIYGDMVTKTQQEIMLQKVMSHIAAVKKDMIILEKSEFSALLAENERIKVELGQLKIQLFDVMNKVRLDNKLDMNSEKSQVKEMKAEHEKKLLETRNEMMEMLNEQDRHVSLNNVKIDTEVAGLKTMLESHKLDSIKYLAGSVFTCLTVVLGFYRIWM